MSCSNHKVRTSKHATARYKFQGDAKTAETSCPIADYMKTSLSVAQWRAGNTPPLPRMEKPANRTRAMTKMLWYPKFQRRNNPNLRFLEYIWKAIPVDYRLW